MDGSFKTCRECKNSPAEIVFVVWLTSAGMLAVKASYHLAENDYRQSFFVFELILTVITVIDTRRYCFWTQIPCGVICRRLQISFFFF